MFFNCCFKNFFFFKKKKEKKPIEIPYEFIFSVPTLKLKQEKETVEIISKVELTLSMSLDFVSTAFQIYHELEYECSCIVGKFSFSPELKKHSLFYKSMSEYPKKDSCFTIQMKNTIVEKWIKKVLKEKNSLKKINKEACCCFSAAIVEYTMHILIHLLDEHSVVLNISKKNVSCFLNHVIVFYSFIDNKRHNGLLQQKSETK